MADQVIIFPDGQRMVAANVSNYFLNGFVLTVNLVDGTQKTFDATVQIGGVADPSTSAVSSLAVLNSFDSAMHTQATAPVQVSSGSPYTLTSFYPNPFVLATDTITINGFGFTPDMNAFIQIDTEWPLDLDSQRMAITYVSPTKITAVFSTNGNGWTSTSYFFVLVDFMGRVSNALQLASID